MKKIFECMLPAVLIMMLIASCGSGQKINSSETAVGSKPDNSETGYKFLSDEPSTIFARFDEDGVVAPGTTIGSVQSGISPPATMTGALPLSGFGAALIDGIMGPGEWDNAASIDFPANIPSNDGGGTTPATLFVMNDGTRIYFAVKVERSSFGGATNPVFEFDNNNNGVREDGDDGFGMSVGIYQSPEFRDAYRYTCLEAPAGSAGCSALDTETTRGILPAGSNDGATAATNDGATTIVEISHPLDSRDMLHDFSLKPGDAVGFHFTLRLFSLATACNFGPSCYADTEIPAAGAGSYYGQIIVASSTVVRDAQAGIDIKPGSFENSINPKSNGKIPVAVLSTPGFDAPATVDITALTFGRTGDEQSLAFCNENGEDVNNDGLSDLVCHFFTQRTGFRPGDFEGILKGRTEDGDFFTGKDSVRIVPPGQ